MEFLDGSWKKEVSSWDALMGEELLNQGSHPGGRHSQYPQHGRCCICNYQKKRGSVSDRFCK